MKISYMNVVMVTALCAATSSVYAQGSPFEPLDARIINDASEPVPVIVQNQPEPKIGPEYFQIGEVESYPAGRKGFELEITQVPADKRAIVEFVSMRTFVDNGDWLICNLDNGVFLGPSHFLNVDTVVRTSDDAKIVSQPIKLIFQPSDQILLRCNADVSSAGTTNPSSVGVNISGYFEPAE